MQAVMPSKACLADGASLYLMLIAKVGIKLS